MDGSAGAAASQPPAKDAAAARADIQKTFGFMPGFLKAVPDEAIPGAWAEFKGFQMNPHTTLPPKVKELIGLAVAAQTPCTYCIYAHTSFGKGNGASEQELGEAVALAASTRRWSTVLNGIETNPEKVRQDVAHWVGNAKNAGSKGAAETTVLPAAEITDADAARRDIEKMFGSVPEFLARYPDQALAGAWREMRDVELNPHTALETKVKDLVGLAVASQIPCAFCITFHTEFAKLHGASPQEINEAIAMAGITRHWSTLVNGLQVDEAGFRKDIDRMVKHAGAKKQAMR
jgi:AhpD family alkylhydroperoxidase